MVKKNKIPQPCPNNNFRSLRDLPRQQEKIDDFTKEISTKKNSEESYQDLVKKQRKKQKEHEIDWDSVKSKIKRLACYGIFGLLGICIIVVYFISILQLFGKMGIEDFDFRNIIFNTVLLGVGAFVGWILNEFLKK